MWRISLIDPKTDKVWQIPFDLTDIPLCIKHTVTTAPILFSEGFNFKGILDGKIAEETLMPLQSFAERWAHCKEYRGDQLAPTMGNIRLVICQLIGFAELHPEGIWQIEA